MYAVMYMVWRFCLLYEFTDGLMPVLARLFVLIVLGLLAGRSLHFYYASDIFPYAAGWMVIAILLDYVMVYPGAGWAMYMNWNIWVGYLLVLAIPLLAPQLQERPEAAHIT